MKFKITPEICQKYPTLSIGYIIVRGADNKTNQSNSQIASLVRGSEAEVRKITPDSLPTHPKIICWRDAYLSFGVKPKEYRSSIENLCRLVCSGTDLRPFSPIVDLYNYISLKHLLPAGAEDLDKMSADIELRFASSSEPPVIMLGEKDARPPKPGEVIYADSISAICRRWNWKEAERTKITEDTKNCIVFIEGLPPSSKEEVFQATAELANLLKEYCGASVNYGVLGKDQLEVDF